MSLTASSVRVLMALSLVMVLVPSGACGGDAGGGTTADPADVSDSPEDVVDPPEDVVDPPEDVVDPPEDVVDTVATDTGVADNASDLELPATEKHVFVTSGTYDANLGGLAGADAKCQASADAVGLLGEYKAWLSDGNVDAAARLSHATVPYRLVDGTELASDWTGLTTADLSAPIDKDESGNAVAPTNMGTNCEDTDYSVVWTNSQEDGTTVFAAYDCSDWTSTANPDTWTAVGSTKELSSWAYSCNNVDACQLFARLFCFEQ